MEIKDMLLSDIEERKAEIRSLVDDDSIPTDVIENLTTENNQLNERKAELEAALKKRNALREAVAERKIVGEPMENTAKADNAEARAKAFITDKRKSVEIMELRSAILTSGNIATPTEVHGINDIEGARVSSIIDFVTVANCEGMSKNRVAYISADIDAAPDQTEGSAATEKEPTFNYVDITPTSIATYSQISKQVRKQSPLQYEAKCTQQALLSLRKKASSMVVAALKASTLVDTVTATLDSNSKGKIDENTLRTIAMNYGGDEGISGEAILFLNKNDLIAFGKVRGTNEKKAVYEIEPDAQNPNTGIIKDGGLAVRYCINSNLTALDGTSQSSSAAIKTMFYGNPRNFELDLFSNYEIAISSDFAFTSLMDTIRGDAEIGGDVVVKNGFVTLQIAKGE